MNRRLLSRGLASLALALGLTTTVGAAPDRQPYTLWAIVHNQCVPAAQAGHAPTPCAKVSLAGGEQAGYAVLKDHHGANQFLLMPTARMPGIESPRLLVPGATDYLAAAWRARHYSEAALGRSLPRDAFSLAVNSQPGRSQDQLHIHIDCVRADVRTALHTALPTLGEGWSELSLPPAGHRYRARLLRGAEPPANGFALLAWGLPPGQSMAQQSLVLAGVVGTDGAPGFILLDGTARDQSSGSGEELQDHRCGLASTL